VEQDRPDQAQPPPEEGTGAASDGADELAQAVHERDEFKALLQRAQADLVNYRKRVQAEREEVRKGARRAVIVRCLEVLDDFEAALDGPAAQGVDAGWLEGIEGIRRKLVAMVEAEGVERFDAEGSVFDPRYHEAVLRTPTADYPAETVIRVLRCGYRQGGDVIRPAQVEISAAPEGGEGALS
jgi:molecular chaperone GrpE